MDSQQNEKYSMELIKVDQLELQVKEEQKKDQEKKEKNCFKKIYKVAGILLNLTDVITDIIQLTNYYRLGYMWYFSLQLTFQIFERLFVSIHSLIIYESGLQALLELLYIDRIICIYEIFFPEKSRVTKKKDEEPLKLKIQLEKVFEALPSCYIAVHFLYFENIQDYFIFFSFFISLISTSIPENNFSEFRDYVLFSILSFCQVYTTCILFGMISDFYRPYSTIFFFGFNLILYIYEVILYYIRKNNCGLLLEGILTILLQSTFLKQFALTGNYKIQIGQQQCTLRDILADTLFLFKNTACIIILAIFDRSTLEEHPIITYLLYVTFSINSIYCINLWKLLFFDKIEFEKDWD